MALSNLPRGVLPYTPDEKMENPLLEPLDIEPEADADDALNIQEQPDGSATFEVDQGKDQSSVQFDANLAEELEESEMQEIANDLMRKIERDQEARKKRDQQYEEGIKRTGLGNDAPGGAQFDGASRAVHPMIAEGCVDFAASAMRELFPPNGPVRTKIEGETTQLKLQRAKRQERYLNWQLTEQISEYCEELEQTLTQVPLGGSQYMKFWFDGSLRRIQCEFVPIDDMLIPFSCSDFYSAQRITHVQRLTQFIYDERVDSHFYRDIGSDVSPETPEETKAGKANDKVEGRESELENVDGERIVYEVNTFAKLSIDGGKQLPYLISIDETTKKVVAIYRNWEEKDTTQTRNEWIVEYGFIAWRGAYKIGLIHLIGGLSAAATGALRALLDSAHINNMPGFLRLKGARLGGQSKQVNPQSGIEVEASVAVDDINKLVMRLPYNPPSETLFKLLGWLDQAAKGVVTTAEEKISEAKNEMPVGTALALIEQGAKVFSSIHARLHRSQRRALRIMARLNAKHISIAEQVNTIGEILATKEDFAEPLSVIPVSDPNIFSETQRYAQMQMVLQLATQQVTAPLHNLYKVLKRMYELAKIPDINEFLPEQKAPTELNSAAEDAAVMVGRPIIAFPEQDHLAHIEVHMRFITDPFLGGAQYAKKIAMPMMIEHIKQHLAFLYAKTIYEIATQSLGADVGEMLKKKESGPEVDRLLAAASKTAHQELMKKLEPLGPVINQIMQEIAAMQPPAPMTPEQAAMKIAADENQRKTKDDAFDAQAKQQELERKKIKDQQDAQLKDRDLDIKEQKVILDAQATDRDLTLSTGVDLTKAAHAREKAQLDAQAKEKANEDKAKALAQANNSGIPSGNG